MPTSSTATTAPRTRKPRRPASPALERRGAGRRFGVNAVWGSSGRRHGLQISTSNCRASLGARCAGGRLAGRRCSGSTSSEQQRRQHEELSKASTMRLPRGRPRQHAQASPAACAEVRCRAAMSPPCIAASRSYTSGRSAARCAASAALRLRGVARQQRGEDRQADRAADLAHQRVEAGGVRHPVRAECCESATVVQRHEEQAEAHALQHDRRR